MPIVQVRTLRHGKFQKLACVTQCDTARKPKGCLTSEPVSPSVKHQGFCFCFVIAEAMVLPFFFLNFF